MPPPRPPCMAPGTETALLITSQLQPPSTVTQQHPETLQGTGTPDSCPLRCPVQGGLDGCISHHVSGSLVLPAQSCLCAYRQNTGKQLAASEPVVSQQESTQMPIPPFPGQDPHFQMCSAGLKFKLLSGMFIHILVSYFVLKPSMCHWPHITFWKMPIRLSTGLPSSLSLTTC